MRTASATLHDLKYTDPNLPRRVRKLSGLRQVSAHNLDKISKYTSKLCSGIEAHSTLYPKDASQSLFVSLSSCVEPDRQDHAQPNFMDETMALIGATVILAVAGSAVYSPDDDDDDSYFHGDATLAPVICYHGSLGWKF